MKQILKVLLPQIGKFGFIKYILLGILSGLFSFLFINAVTKVIGVIITGSYVRISPEYVIVFSLIIVLFIWTRKVLSLGIIKLSQTLSWKLRTQILSSMLNAKYEHLAHKKVEVHSAIMNDVYVLTDASVNIISFLTSMILGLSCFIYLATISWALFFITLLVTIIGATLYQLKASKNNKNFELYREYENKFLANINSILDGFKEIYMEPKIGRKIYDQKIQKIAKDSYRVNVIAFAGFLNNQITGQILFYLLISSVLLFFSVWLRIRPADIVSFVFTLLYLLGSIESVMVFLPSLMRAKVAANHLVTLQEEIENNKDENITKTSNIERADFEKISVQDLEYFYDNKDRVFGIGPINFEIDKGNVIFIFGGNGSGKTTFIHALLGICSPSGGSILLNGTTMNAADYPLYKSLFSVVFSDFYLFDEIYSIENIDIEKWNTYIDLFELDNKVSIENNRFSTTDLSTGQRKRLALISSLLEEKPILIIDEWAADQDPYFRKKFYTEIIPKLKEYGITIVAITHDDKYYDCADRLYKMEDGKLIEENISLNRNLYF